MKRQSLGIAALLLSPYLLFLLYWLVSSPGIQAQIQAGAPVPRLQDGCGTVTLAGQLCFDTSSSDPENPDIYVGNSAKAARIMTAATEGAPDLNTVAAVGPRYSGAISEATAIQIDNGATTPMGYRIYTHPTYGPEMTAFWGTTLLSDSVRIFPSIPGGVVLSDGAGLRQDCFLWDNTGLVTMSATSSCRWLLSGQAMVRSTDGTQCGAITAAEIRTGTGAQNLVRCSDNDASYLFLTDITPPQNWVTGTMALLRVWFVSTAASPSGHFDLVPSLVCKRTDNDTLETTWTDSASASVTTMDTQYKLESATFTDVPIGGTCTSTSIIQARIRVEDSSTATGMGTSGTLYVLADSIQIAFYAATSR